MAKVTEDGLSGSIGNVVFYSVNGNKYARSKPGRGKKSRKKSENSLTSIFGTVSTYGSAMIKRMSTSFLFKFNRDTYNIMRGWMRNHYAEHRDNITWELSVRNSGMGQLNSQLDLRDFIRMDITVTDNGNGNLTVAFAEMVPKRDIKAPLRTRRVNIKLVVATSAFGATGIPSTNVTEEHGFDYTNDLIPAKLIELQTGAPQGHIALVAVALEYEISGSPNGLYSRDIKWLPAAVVAIGKLKAG